MVVRGNPFGGPSLVVAMLVVAGAAAAAGYGLTAPKQYDATAELLVAPVSAADPTFAGLDVLRDASGRRTAAQSAAALLKTPEVAQAVDLQLGLRRSTGSLLDHVRTHVVDRSDVIDVTGEDSSAGGAARLANAFVDALIARRTATFQSQLSGAVHRDAQLLASSSGGPQAGELARRLAVLRGFVGQADPTLRRAPTAVAPASASWPGWAGLILTGAGAGLAAGLVCALALLLWRRRGAAYDRPVTSPASDDRAAEALVDRLEERLAKREAALAARERDLQQRIDELRALESRPAVSADDSALAGRERALAERERQLEERVAAVTQRELAVARAAAQTAAPSPAPAPVAARANGGYNLGVLERLVAGDGRAHPDRLEEWQSYLFFLRDHAGADGDLPRSFDALVEETFRPLLG